jgi:hypothetical protein
VLLAAALLSGLAAGGEKLELRWAFYMLFLPFSVEDA